MKQRILELDLLRGLAVLGMIIFHFLFVLDFFDIHHFDLSTNTWLVLARIVQFTFLILVGIGITFSRNNLKRGASVLIAALIVTLATYLAEPELYVRFGILHLIALSILLLAPFKKLKYLNLFLAAIILLINYFISQIATSSLPLIIIGFHPLQFASLDYFPLIPWIALPLIGIYLGNTIYAKRLPLIDNRYISPLKPLLFLGRHALPIYLLHVPAIILLLQSLLLFAKFV